jgi:hypothetical protein
MNNMKAPTTSILYLLLVFLTLIQTGYGLDDTKNSSQLRRRNAAVTRLELINAKTDKKISDLFFGQYVNVSSITGLTGPEFNINAVVDGSVDFVRFGYNNNLRYNSEGAVPYAFCGNTGRRNFLNCSVLGYGTHFVTAQAIANMTPGPLVQVTFTIAPI